MGRVLHLLIMVTLLWCGLHSDDAAHAHDGADQHGVALELQVAPEDFDSGEHGRSTGAHAGHHHHCPVAPDLSADVFACPAVADGQLVSPRPIPGLTSRSQAPPLQPPSA